MADDAQNTELLARVHCILKHCQQTERDGLANSLSYLRAIVEDARALEDLLIDGESKQPVHLG